MAANVKCVVFRSKSYRGGRSVLLPVSLPTGKGDTYGSLAQWYTIIGATNAISRLRYNVIVKPIVSGQISQSSLARNLGIHPITIRKILKQFKNSKSSRSSLRPVGVGGRTPTLSTSAVKKICEVRTKRGTLSFEVAKRHPELWSILNGTTRSVYYRALSREGAYRG